jgi:Endoribonuclease YbeY
MKFSMVRSRVGTNLFTYRRPRTNVSVWVQQNNRRRRSYSGDLARAQFLIYNEISRLTEAERKCLAGRSVPLIVGVVLCSERDVSAVNWRGLRVQPDRAFPLLTPICPARPGSACIWRFTPKGTLWEVLVCSDVAASNARMLGVPYREELVRYAIHGLLHLAGDFFVDADLDSEPARRMFRRQEELLEATIGRRPSEAGRMDVGDGS